MARPLADEAEGADPGVVGAADAVGVVIGVVGADLERQRDDRASEHPAPEQRGRPDRHGAHHHGHHRRGQRPRARSLHPAGHRARCGRGGAWVTGGLRELREVGLAVLDEGVATLLALLGHVEEHRGVTRELLDARQAVVGRVEARLEHPQRERRQRQDLAAPGHGLGLELGQRHHGVDQAPVERRRRRRTGGRGTRPPWPA